MYYAEELINGIWHYRTTPKGEWIEMTKEQISERLNKERKRLKELESRFKTFEMSDDVMELIKAEQENRMKRIETFVPAFEENVKCHFFWFRTA